MHKLVTHRVRGIPRHRRAGAFAVASLVGMLGFSAPAAALDGPFLGLDVGGSVPVNNNYRAHVADGITGNPYVGYMFNNYIGIQGQLQVDTQWPDNDHRGFPNENQVTTALGYLVGPRLQLPLMDSPFGQPMEFYITGQGGGYSGLSGRLKHTSGGVSAGAGLDVYLTDHLALSFWGRWNQAWQAPRPTFLVYQDPNQQGPENAQWANGGLGLKYRFKGPVAPPPPPPPPPPVAQAPPPVKKKIVLRGVNFDFNKSNIRPDARPILDEAISTLKQYQQITLSVEGHTDSIGTEEYNQKLSMRRAKSVADYLAKGGIDPKRMTEKGLGESQPVASNDTAEGRAQNRRVELKILQGP
ncbi:MAG TPA: OmpA family protein [Candidatus Margulisiibacteriota bacterium]|nr:OmpA family protein [Candidatus Margulisiibacteriota bacterium]